MVVVEEDVEDAKAEDFLAAVVDGTFDDIFREFDDMRRETERMFSEQFKNIENKVPKRSN